MFNTVDVKSQWQTVFCCGNTVDPQDIVLVLGSCRVVPYINYLHEANAVCGNRFKIYCIDPINYMVDSAGNKLDTAGLLKALETDERFLSILKSVTIFVHEGLSSFGILNTLRDAETNIYQFGIAPKHDINIPNFHDVFILFNDFKTMGACPDITSGGPAFFIEGEHHIDRFCAICHKSSFPEFAQWFRDNYLERRLFHSFNHVSSAFTLEIFRLMNEKFLKLELDENFWQQIGKDDMYANVQTPVTDLDRKWRAFRWT